MKNTRRIEVKMALSHTGVLWPPSPPHAKSCSARVGNGRRMDAMCTCKPSPVLSAGHRCSHSRCAGPRSHVLVTTHKYGMDYYYYDYSPATGWSYTTMPPPQVIAVLAGRGAAPDPTPCAHR